MVKGCVLWIQPGMPLALREIQRTPLLHLVMIKKYANPKKEISSIVLRRGIIGGENRKRDSPGKMEKVLPERTLARPEEFHARRLIPGGRPW